MKKDIGIMTFHWANNYGAVLQSYALQNFLLKNGIKANIINYQPIRLKLSNLKQDILKKNKKEIIKFYNINRFSKHELKMSKVLYFFKGQLKYINMFYKFIITGSDQVWNVSWINAGNLCYYLDFCNFRTKRISYAASFGTEKLNNYEISLIKSELEKFKAISVRENKGKEILQNIDIESQVVLDPTLLLTSEDYNELLVNKKLLNCDKVFSYIIQKHQDEAIKISNFIKKINSEKFVDTYYYPIYGIYDWINHIKNAELVVTNSFHGIVFSIIYHKKFIAILVKNSEMNDRVFTLLNNLGLEDRIIEDYDEEKINSIIKKEINWIDVVNKIKNLQEESRKYLLDALK